MVDYSKKSVKDLQALASKKKIVGRSKLSTKAKLVDALNKAKTPTKKRKSPVKKRKSPAKRKTPTKVGAYDCIRHLRRGTGLYSLAEKKSEEGKCVYKRNESKSKAALAPRVYDVKELKSGCVRRFTRVGSKYKVIGKESTPKKCTYKK